MTKLFRRGGKKKQKETMKQDLEFITIVMACDDNYAQHLGVCLVSLFDNNKENNFRVYIFENKVSKSNNDKLKKISDDYHQEIIFQELSLSDFEGFPITSYYSPVTFFRLKIADILPNSIKRVLYLDADMIVDGDITELWNTDLEGNTIAAVKDTPWQQEYMKSLKDIPSDMGYFNAGMLLIDMDKYKSENVFQAAKNIVESGRYTLDFLDQDILNLLFIGKWKQMDCKWNLLNGFLRKVYLDTHIYPEMEEGIKSRVIIHYSAAEKPWKYWCPNPLKSRYFYYLKKSPWRNVKVLRNSKQKLLYPLIVLKNIFFPKFIRL